MAKKTPAKKTAAKPLKKAPAKKLSKPAPRSFAKPSAKPLIKAKPSASKTAPPKKPVKKPARPQLNSTPKKQAKKAPAKKISKPAPRSFAKPSAKPLIKSKPSASKTAPSKKLVTASGKPQIKKAPVNVAKKAAGKATPKSSKKALPAKKVSDHTDRVLAQKFVRKPAASKITLTPFLVRQRQRLLELKDTLLDSMRGVARDNLHAGSETSAFGMHQADAGSDAYDRDFALSMLSKEQGSLYEIDEALKRIEDGTYGVCDICEKPIRHDRLEALPFTRYTVECQAELEKRQHHHSVRPHINSLFGLTEEEAESEEEESNDNS